MFLGTDPTALTGHDSNDQLQPIERGLNELSQLSKTKQGTLGCVSGL